MKRIAVLAITLISKVGLAQNVLTLERAIELGVSHSRQIAITDADREAQQSKQSLTAFGPRANIGFSAVRFDAAVASQLGPSKLELRPEQVTVGNISVVQPLMGAFAATRAYKLQEKNIELAEINKTVAEIDVRFAMAREFLLAQQAQEIVQIASASVKSAESQKHDAEAMLKTGRLIRVGFLKIDIARLEASAALAKAQSMRDKIFALLASDLGVTVAEISKLDTLMTAEGVEKASESFLQADPNPSSRLELKLATLDVERTTQTLSLARARLLPSVDLFAKIEHDFGTPAFGYPDTTKSVGITANWEIWDTGTRYYALDEQAAMVHKSRLALEEKQEKFRLEQQDLRLDLKAAREALVLARGGVAQAEEAFRLEQARFASGLSTATDLILAETARTRARGNVVSAVGEVRRLIFEIQRTLGQTSPT